MLALFDINNMFGNYPMNFLRCVNGERFIFNIDDGNIGFEVYFDAAPGDYVSNGMLFKDAIDLFTVRKVVMLNITHRRLTIYDDMAG